MFKGSHFLKHGIDHFQRTETRGSWISKNFKNPKQGVVNKIKEPPSTDLNQCLVCLWHQALSGY